MGNAVLPGPPESAPRLGEQLSHPQHADASLQPRQGATARHPADDRLENRSHMTTGTPAYPLEGEQAGEQSLLANPAADSSRFRGESAPSQFPTLVTRDGQVTRTVEAETADPDLVFHTNLRVERHDRREPAAALAIVVATDEHIVAHRAIET